MENPSFMHGIATAQMCKCHNSGKFCDNIINANFEKRIYIAMIKKYYFIDANINFGNI